MIIKIIFLSLIVGFAVVLYFPRSGAGTKANGGENQEATKGSCQDLTMPDIFKANVPTNSTPPTMQVCFNAPKPRNGTPNSSLRFDPANPALATVQVFFGMLTLMFLGIEVVQLLAGFEAWRSEKKNLLQTIIIVIS